MTAKPEVIREARNEKLIGILNAMIAAGVGFDVAENEFQIVNADRLKQVDIDFLRVNRNEVLCTVQQSLLMKHLFSYAADSLEDFSNEVYEREGFLTEQGKVSFDAHFEAVRQITKKWFINLLNLN